MAALYRECVCSNLRTNALKYPSWDSVEFTRRAPPDRSPKSVVPAKHEDLAVSRTATEQIGSLKHEAGAAGDCHHCRVLASSERKNA
jgi:hypothetical protein